ncbi:MAG: radical SAM protein [Candidatus Omnitrophica bacterium]|nr:radical SAM protein [Candidatus Omnitrophota bacterium]
MKTANFTKELGHRLQEKRNALNFPPKVMFELTYRCNLDCRHCYIVKDPSKRELSSAQVKSLLGQIADAGCLHVIFTGGEPLVRKDLFSLIAYARRRGLFVHLFTNATLLDERDAVILKGLGLISLEISLYSAKRERFDFITRRRGSFDRLMNALMVLKKSEVRFVLNSLIMNLTLDEIGDLKHLADSFGADIWWNQFLLPKRDGSRENLRFRLEPEEIMKAITSIDAVSTLDAAGSAGNGTCSADIEVSRNATETDSVFRNKFFSCGVGIKNSLVISPYGELLPCANLPSIGISAIKEGIRKGWKRLIEYTSSLRPSADYKCDGCELRSFCLSCPALAGLECGNINSCPQFHREFAELKRQKYETDRKVKDLRGHHAYGKL